MKNWTTLNEVCVKITDGSHFSPAEDVNGELMASSKDMLENGWDFSNIKKISKEDFDKLVKSDCKPLFDDVLIIKDGNNYLEKVFTCKKEINLVILSSIAILRPNTQRISSLFLQYLLRAKYIKEAAANFVSGAAIPRVILSDFKKVKIPDYPLPTQQRIAYTLGAYDELIEVNNQRIKLLEETARELYKHWFVRMRFPGYKKAKLIKGLPQDWQVKKLKECNEFKYGTMPKPSLIKEKGYPIFSGYGIVGFYEKRMFEEKTLIVVARGVGGTGDIKLTPPNCWLTNLAIAILPNNIDIKKYFLYYTLSAIDLRYLDSGSAQSQITIADLGNLKLPIASIELQEKFESIVIPINYQVDNIQQQNAQLRQIRDRLLPRLVSGKLVVKLPKQYESHDALSMAAEP